MAFVPGRSQELWEGAWKAGSPTTMRTAQSCLRQPFTTGMAAPGFTGKPVVRTFAGEHELLAVSGV